MSNQIYAALDAGTNTMRLLVATVDSQGLICDIRREVNFAKLGEGVDATGVFSAAAMQRGWDLIEHYRAEMSADGVTRARFVATSASRDAANADEFYTKAEQILGFPPEVICGDDEARLSFQGAISGADLAGDPVLVMDSGGGSTELVCGRSDGTIDQAVSLNIGSRRIRERFLHDDPPTPEQIEQARVFVDSQLDSSGIDLGSVRTYIGVAGTVTTMAALAMGLSEYSRERVHASITSPEMIEALTSRLLASRVDEVKAMGPVASERAAVLCAGALIVERVSARTSEFLQACESDILDGVVLSMVREPERGHTFQA